MGNRRENMTPAIVIDLDETLVTVNTFHHFMKFTAKKTIKTRTRIENISIIIL